MIGRTLSEYRLIEKIGGGGMGVVWKAEDIELQAFVALKFLPPEVTRDPGAKERFLREARVAFGLDHPNICTVHGVGETDEGNLFIVMPYYEGRTLDAMVRDGALDPGTARGLFSQLAAGLSYAHGQGVVHRDIKPANLMVTSGGALKILDFGLARLADRTMITEAGTTVGTIAYMSPEQARGDTVDGRTDIWAAGVVLYEMLAGVRPFRGDYQQVVVYSILNTDPEPVTAVRDGIPDDLAGICMQCLAKDRDRRPSDLTAAMRSAAGASPPSSAAGRSTVPAWFGALSPARRMGILATAALAIACILLIVLTPRTPHDPGSLVAVAPFRNLTGNPALDQWLEPMQSMVDHEMRHLGLNTYDIGGINTYVAGIGGLPVASGADARDQKFRERGIRYLVEGDLGTAEAGFSLRLELRDLKAGGVNETDPVAFREFTDANVALVRLIPQVTAFLRMKDMPMQKGDDLEAWTAGHRLNIQAHQALMQAYGSIYRMEPGGDRFLRRAIELDSLFVTPRVWLISSLSTKGLQDEAMDHYRFLREIEADADPFEQSLIDWSGAYIRRDDAAQVRSLRAALEYSPGNNILIVNLARLLWLDGDLQGVIDVIRPVIAMEWKYSPAYWFFASACMRLGRFDEARDALEKGMQISPAVWPENYGLLAVIYYRQGDTVRCALNTSKFVSSSRPRDDSLWLAYSDLGTLYNENSLPDGAVTAFRKAVAGFPAWIACRDSLVSALVAARRFDEARRECGAMRDLDPRGTATLYLEGRIEEGLGRRESAIRSYERFLLSDSTGGRARDARERLSRIIH